MNPSNAPAGTRTPERSENQPPGDPLPKQPPHTCGGCDTRWTSLKTAHCAACHHTFTGIYWFDTHRTQEGEHGTCHDPATITDRDGQPRLTQRPNGHWGGPEPTDADRARLDRLHGRGNPT